MYFTLNRFLTSELFHRKLYLTTVMKGDSGGGWWSERSHFCEAWSKELLVKPIGTVNWRTIGSRRLFFRPSHSKLMRHFWRCKIQWTSVLFWTASHSIWTWNKMYMTGLVLILLSRIMFILTGHNYTYPATKSNYKKQSEVIQSVTDCTSQPINSIF